MPSTTRFRPLSLALLLTLLAAAGLGCGSEADPADVLLEELSPREGYPAGPYGTAVNSVLAELEFVDSEGQPFSFRTLYADPHNKLLLLSTAAGWCSACIEEQPSLQQRYLEHGPRGLEVLVAYFENASYDPASVADAAAWKSRHKLGFPVLADTAFQLAAYYDPSLTPLNMLVELSTMKILWMGTGWDPSTVDAIISSKL